MFDLIISTQNFIFLMIASFLAGFLDSIAGGGGLISLPAYVLTGLPMHMVYACNKFAAACGTTIATLRYYRNKMVDIPIGLTAAAGAFLCSAIASRIVLYLDDHTLKTMMLIVLPIVAVITLVNKNMGNENLSHQFSQKKKYVLSFLIGSFVGFYDGLVGPGTGTFALIGFCLVLKYDMRTATGNAKFLNLASNYASLVVFLFAGTVYWIVAVPAAVFNILGNYIGAGVAIKKGAAVIKKMLMVVIVLLFFKVLSEFIM
jgi:uncharacterized membrane protein YfcA